MLPQSRSSTLPTCGYEGISEVYGLGIRVGIYLQWMSGIICKDFLGEDALHDVLNENTIFLFAIFLATILLVTGTISGVHSVDILIMLHIFFGSIYTIFADERRVTARIEFFSSLIGILFKSGVATGMAAIGVWFWFYDIHVPADPTCSQYAFLFGRVGFYSPGTIKAFKAFSVINLMICGTCMLATIIVRINVWMYKAFLISKPFPAESLQERTKKPSLVVKLRRWVISGRYSRLFCMFSAFTVPDISNSLPAKKDYYEEYNALKLQSFREMEAKRKQAWSNGPAGTFGFSMTMGLLEGPIGSMILKNLLPDHVQEPLNVLSLDQKRQLLIEISGRPNLLKSFAAKRVRSPTFLSEREQSAILDDLSDRPELANFLAVLWDMSPLTQRSPRRATSKNGNEFGVVERIWYEFHPTLTSV